MYLRAPGRRRQVTLLTDNPAVIPRPGRFIMPQPESKLVKRIQKLIVEHGGRATKIHGDDNFQEVGISDLLVCYKGRFLALEVKLPGEGPSPMQRVYLGEIVSSGGYAAVVSTVEQVARLLAEVDREVKNQTSYAGGLSRRRQFYARSLPRQGGK